jgi:hypothetical protein
MVSYADRHNNLPSSPQSQSNGLLTPAGPVEDMGIDHRLDVVTAQNPLRGQDMTMEQGRQARIIYECSYSKDLGILPKF